MTHRVRRGFTLIELLVVVGIIAVLVAIAVLGYNHFNTVAGEKATHANLQVCAGFLKSYDPSESLMYIEGANSVYGTKASVGSPGDVNFGGGGRFSGAVLNTAHIFQIFRRIPDVNALISQMPGQSLLQPATGTGGSGAWIDAATNLPLPVLLDGWKNPIIYVPSGGLTGVYIGGPRPPASPTSGIWGKLATIKSIDGRPFWASAGADGSFDTGDDNLYSSPVVATFSP